MKIFHNNLNKSSKIVTIAYKSTGTPSAAGRHLDTTNIKSLPSFSKEWKNIIYCYNQNNLKNIPLHNININKIIQSYFNLYFKDRKYLNCSFNSLKRKTKNIKLVQGTKRRNFLRRIYVSNAEIKHTNHKAIITLYTVNREKKILQKKYLKINKMVSQHLIERSFLLYNHMSRLALAKIAIMISGLGKYKYITKLDKVSKKNFLNYKLYSLTKLIQFKNTYLKKIWSFIVKNYWNRYLNLLRKYDLLYSLNQSKFNKQVFLSILSSILTKIIKKKIQYNIINLKSIAFHTDLFTTALALKIKKPKLKYKKSMSRLLNRAILPIINTTKELAPQNTSLYKYKDLALISIACAFVKDQSLISENKLARFFRPGEAPQRGLGKIQNIDKILGNSCNISQVHNTIYKSIAYKNMGGMRLEVTGRLSKRYRAERSKHSLKWKGGLQNEGSSIKGLSSVLFRGNSKSNVSYSIYKTKRRIGAFAVKGWISGK